MSTTNVRKLMNCGGEWDGALRTVWDSRGGAGSLGGRRWGQGRVQEGVDRVRPILDEQNLQRPSRGPPGGRTRRV